MRRPQGDIVWHDAEPLVPHRPPMLMVGSVALAADGQGWGKTTVSAHWPCLGPEGESLPAEACAEMVAQTYAGVRALTTLQAGAEAGAAPRIGFLAGLRDFRFGGSAPRVGDELFILLAGETSVGDVTLVEGRVFFNDERIAEGQVKIYVPPLRPDAEEGA